MAGKATKQDLSWFLPAMAQAVQRAENDPTGMNGVRSLSTSNPDKVLNNSITNNFDRWSTGQNPAPWIGKDTPHPDGTPFNRKKLVDFMHRRWAPIGSENDKKDENGEWLNSHWDNNVRSTLQQILGDEKYKKAQQLDLVKVQQGGQAWT